MSVVNQGRQGGKCSTLSVTVEKYRFYRGRHVFFCVGGWHQLTVCVSLGHTYYSVTRHLRHLRKLTSELGHRMSTLEILRYVAWCPSASKGGTPTMNSYARTPNDQMSVELSCSLPWNRKKQRTPRKGRSSSYTPGGLRECQD